MSRESKSLLILLLLLFFIAGSIFIGIGFNRKDVYDSRHGTNAYVGGDAYNYIINGTHFVGYCVLGGTLYIMGTICLVVVLSCKQLSIHVDSKKLDTSKQVFFPSNDKYDELDD